MQAGPNAEAGAKGVEFVRAPARAFPRFDLAEGAEARQHLAEHGFCVFRGAATAAELARTELLFWDWCERQEGLGISRRDPRTLRGACWRPLASGESTHRSGLLSQRGIGQSAFMWAVRSLSGVRGAFGAAWGVGADELVTGFDSCAVTRNLWLAEREQLRAAAGGSDDGSEPEEPQVSPWATNLHEARWFHVDQNWHDRPGLSTFQGLLSFYGATAASGGTVLVPGSHLRFAEPFRDAHAAAREHPSEGYVALDKPGDHARYCAAGMAVQVLLEPGDALLWDSRTVHCNQGLDRRAGPEAARAARVAAPAEPPMLCRLVAFVCMLPRSALEEACARDPGLRERRRRYVREGHTGPHHPLLLSEPVPGFWGYVDQPQPPGAYTPPPVADAALWALVG